MLAKQTLNRREFIQTSGLALGVSGLDHLGIRTNPTAKSIKIKRVDANFEREPLNPYRFKGSAITDSWQTAALLESESDIKKVGIATQGVLWSDSKVFAAHSESAGNALMYAMSEQAVQMLKGATFSNPVELMERLLPEVLAYGKKITNNPDLRKTFALNALVCVDNAAWLLYAEENNLKTFGEMVPQAYKQGL